jgi:hypothetical protein
MDKSTNDITYRINRDDVFELVSDNWQLFHKQNGGADHCKKENILGSPLWKYISGTETTHLYEIMLKAVRDTKKTMKFLFRCDSPDLRRYLELTVIPLQDGAVQFHSRVIRTESREPVDILRKDVERSEELVTMCCICKKMKVADDIWEEVEQAINTLKLFDHEQLPQITHGICDDCYGTYIKMIRNP